MVTPPVEDTQAVELTPTDCEVCESLSEATRSSLKGTTISDWHLPGISKLCQSSCPRHVPFFKYLLDRTGMTASDEFPFFELNTVCSTIDFSSTRLYLSQANTRDRWGWFDRVERVKGVTICELLADIGSPKFRAKHPELASDTRPSMRRSIGWKENINIGLLNHWIRYCDENHENICGKLPADEHENKFALSWLIDVEQWCLVPAPQNARYVALSYVWGQVPMVKTMESNVSNHQRPGALKSVSDDMVQIPATIQNAIHLTSRLEGNIKYLWVDSLCIVQDDEHSLNQHIKHMGSIYEAASLTIVAANGPDARQELKGLEGISSPRPVAPFLEFDDHLKIRALVYSPLSDSSWAGRGWTFQEGIFSRRKLIFFEDRVQWVCQELTTREELIDPHPSFRELKIRSLRFSYPNLKSLADLFGDFNRRSFTYPGDVLNAIAGTLNALAPAYPAGFIYGLPISYLDCFLLWASKTSGQGRRRKASSPALAHDIPPSWSWAGWEGLDPDISGNTNSAKLSFRSGILNETISMLDWSTRDSLTSPLVRVPRQNEWYGFRRQYMGMRDALPPGWHYQLDTQLKWSLHPEAPEGFYYSHESLSRIQAEEATSAKSTVFASEILLTVDAHNDDEGNVKFWHPVPVGRDKPDQPPRRSNRSFVHGRYLCANAQSAHLWIQPHEKPESETSGDSLENSEFAIADKSGVPMGRLLIDGANEYSRVKSELQIPEEGSARYPCEIVAISRCVSLSGRSIPFPPGEEILTKYNVLWIEWDSGVAFRRGMGRLSSDAWDNLDLKNIELVLG